VVPVIGICCAVVQNQRTTEAKTGPDLVRQQAPFQNISRLSSSIQA
jgi:hypothetical protein